MNRYTSTMNTPFVRLSFCLLFGLTAAALADTVWLDEMDLAKMKQGWGKPQVNRSMRELPLSIGGKKFELSLIHI